MYHYQKRENLHKKVFTSPCVGAATCRRCAFAGDLRLNDETKKQIPQVVSAFLARRKGSEPETAPFIKVFTAELRSLLSPLRGKGDEGFFGVTKQQKRRIPQVGAA